MTTIPARLARLTTSSGSWPVAQARSRSLYRQWYRSGNHLPPSLSPSNSLTPILGECYSTRNRPIIRIKHSCLHDQSQS